MLLAAPWNMPEPSTKFPTVSHFRLHFPPLHPKSQTRSSTARSLISMQFAVVTPVKYALCVKGLLRQCCFALTVWAPGCSLVHRRCCSKPRSARCWLTPEISPAFVITWFRIRIYPVPNAQADYQSNTVSLRVLLRLGMQNEHSARLDCFVGIYSNARGFLKSWNFTFGLPYWNCCWSLWVARAQTQSPVYELWRHPFCGHTTKVLSLVFNALHAH